LRIVLDTNVLVSGLLNPHGAPGRIVDLLTSGDLVLLHDDRIIAEYREVLARPRFGFGGADVSALLGFIEWSGEAVVARPLGVVLPDPDDLPFLEVAAAGEADALVSGNTRHFKPTRGKHRVKVCDPARFWATVSGADET